MLTIGYVVLFVGVIVGGLEYAHVSLHGSFNMLQLALAVFEAVNFWIALCEISLLLYSSKIQKSFKDIEAKLGIGRLPPVFLFDDAPLSRILTFEYWSKMWSQYSTLDPSYSETTSFGFCIDIGNGITTLIPTAIFALGMTWPVLPARWLGMIGLVVHYQVAHLA